MASVRLILRRAPLVLIVPILLICLALWFILSSTSPDDDSITSLLSDFPEKNNLRAWKSQLQCPPPPLRWDEKGFYPADSNVKTLEIAPGKIAPLCRPSTPLFIAFGSKCCLLEQTIASYIAEGWPCSQIVVVDNTGHALENAAGSVQDSEHYHLNYTRMQKNYGVSVFGLPIRLTFAQYQNWLLHLAKREGIDDFYWSHQDIIVRSDPNLFPSFFHGILAEKEQLASRFSKGSKEWAFGFFSYDWLAHVNVRAAEVVGQWDQWIPYYHSDCDYYGRARRKELLMFDFPIGRFFDVGSCLTSPQALFAQAQFDNAFELDDVLQQMHGTKADERNHGGSWQGRTADKDVSDDSGPGFEYQIDAGRKWFKKKWGTWQCNVPRQ
ncbi:hypothetical protein H2198_004043 [Neophaeococcomyces mojaviensis]|uniref:Uncharacterized protein n=1 Tax=Neophaeococcomyces mojaviensis TaxID=3383035 RepID=A0ACC3A9Y9_9EURO|nr:hypothetical protein H2198_004043 [Knufia sp. JES_112]